MTTNDGTVIADMIDNCKVELTKESINRLLDICASLNERINAIDHKLKEQGNSIYRLFNPNP